MKNFSSRRMFIFTASLFCLSALYGCNSEQKVTAISGPVGIAAPKTAPAPVPDNEPPPAETGNHAVVVYSPHGHFLENDIKTRFEAEFKGWTLEFVDMGGATILSRVQREKDRPVADAWWGGSPGDFKRAEAAGLLKAYKPAWADALPADAKSPTFGWTATFRTPEVIMYNTEKVKKEDVPTTWDGLLDPRWKGKIVIRDVRQSSTMKTIFGSLIWRELKRTGNETAGFDFLRKLDANTGQYTGNPELMYEALKKEGPAALTLWNVADAPLLKGRGYPFEYVLPKPTPVPVEPVALIKNGPNPAGARKFYDFINRPEQLILMAHERFRVPARTDVPTDKLPAWMKEMLEKLEPMPVEWSVLDEHLEEWIAKWDGEIKGKGGQ